MLLRTAQPDDALEVARLHVRAWQAAYRGLLWDDYLDDLRPEEWAARYTFGEHGPERPSTIVAVERDTICGFATVGPATDPPGAGELMALYVDPDRQGLGVGRALIEDARARLARGGCAEAVLWVLDGNVSAERFYRLDGWAADGVRRPAMVAGISTEDLRYRRTLV